MNTTDLSTGQSADRAGEEHRPQNAELRAAMGAEHYLLKAVERVTGLSPGDWRIKAVAIALYDAIMPALDVVEHGYGGIWVHIAGNWVSSVDSTRSHKASLRPKDWGQIVEQWRLDQGGATRNLTPLERQQTRKV